MGHPLITSCNNHGRFTPPFPLCHYYIDDLSSISLPICCDLTFFATVNLERFFLKKKELHIKLLYNDINTIKL